MDTASYLLALDTRLRASDDDARRVARTEMEAQVFGCQRRDRSIVNPKLGGGRTISMRVMLRCFFEDLRDEDLQDLL